MAIETRVLEVVGDKAIEQIKLINKQGIVASFLTLGATWQEFLVPEKNGELKNLVMGFDLPSDYGKNSLCAGQTIGRVAGRIGKAQAWIEGECYQLPVNNNANCLHGGPNGFHTQHWTYTTDEGSDFQTVTFYYQAREDVDGFPGDFDVVAEFTLYDDNRLTMTFTGKNATQTTLFNPTTHPYFNLSSRQDLQTHQLQIKADHVLETDEELIPSGVLLDVTGTPYDFRKGQNLGSAIDQNDGFDNAFVVKGKADNPVVILSDEESGDQLSIYSDRQGVVVYTMDFLDEEVYFARDKGLRGLRREGVAIEAQDLPDAVNHDHFDQVFLGIDDEKVYQITFAYERIK